MQIQLNTDRNIDANEDLRAQVTDVVESKLKHFSDRITRIEVHLSDKNAEKGGSDDKRCAMEARVAGRQPTTVTHEGPTVTLAVTGAAAKLERVLTSALGKLGR